MTQETTSKTGAREVSRARVIWRLRCPACGEGKLLRGMAMRPSCSQCGHDFAGYGTADGPAYIAICMVSTIVTILATYVELVFRPDFWVHAVLWAPTIIGLSLLCLRHAKGWIVATHYAHAIHEPTTIAQVRHQHQGSAHSSQPEQLP